MSDLNKKIKMFKVLPTIGGRILKSKPIKSKAGASKFEKTMKSGLNIPGYNVGGLSKKQKMIASKAPPKNKIDGKDFAVLKAEKAKGRAKGLQDEKMKPGKVMKAKYGKVMKAKYGKMIKANEGIMADKDRLTKKDKEYAAKTAKEFNAKRLREAGKERLKNNGKDK